MNGPDTPLDISNYSGPAVARATRPYNGPAPTTITPILVSTTTGRKLIDCGRTKFWQLVRAGRIRLVDVGGGRKMVAYESLRDLLNG